MRILTAATSLLGLAIAGLAQDAGTTPLTITGLAKGAPLSVKASHDDQQLNVILDIQPSWHLYGRDTGGGEPVTIEITGGAFESAGNLATPMDGNGEITGRALLRLPLRRTAAGQELQARMRFMVCDPLECLPPFTLQLATSDADTTNTDTTAEPIKVLLVAVDKDERTQRIATFLQERGFSTEVTTYADVDAKQCDTFDVVLADSPTFRLVKGQTANARRFPATKTPIVAVGFLGTELIEGQKVAMTSGYI